MTQKQSVIPRPSHNLWQLDIQACMSSLRLDGCWKAKILCTTCLFCQKFLTVFNFETWHEVVERESLILQDKAILLELVKAKKNALWVSRAFVEVNIKAYMFLCFANFYLLEKIKHILYTSMEIEGLINASREIGNTTDWASSYKSEDKFLYPIRNRR